MPVNPNRKHAKDPGQGKPTGELLPFERPERRPPPAMPLEAIDRWTSPFRSRLAARYEWRAAAYAARAREAWDATQAAYLGADEGSAGVDVDPQTGEVTDRALKQQGEFWDAFSVARTVPRVRRRWKPWRDRQGRARRSLEVSKVDVLAYQAHASAAAWHGARAGGQRSRRATVEHCGVGEVRVTCGCCGAVTEGHVHCGVVRLCAGCSARRAKKARARLISAIEVVAGNARQAGRMLKNQRGGALGERFLTLTIPHLTLEPREVEGAWGWARTFDHGLAKLAARKATSELRIGTLYAAWKIFLKRLNGWIRKKLGPTKAERKEGIEHTVREVGTCWHRAFEWTPGADGMGHPHFHLWMLSPWIPEQDEHEIDSIEGGKRRPTTRCKAGHEEPGAWGWAHAMRRERCPFCVAPKDLEGYRQKPFALRYRAPAVKRTPGVRSWWAEALATLGLPVDAALVNVDVRRVWSRPVEFMREVRKTRGAIVRRRDVHRLRLESSAGDVIDYLEGWCVATLDERTREHAGAEVLAGVDVALEGKRLSQSSKVVLRTRSGALRVTGLMRIADERYDASCPTCVDAASRAGKAWSFSERKIEVDTWSKVMSRGWAPELPEATGPPPELSADERYHALVQGLRQRDALVKMRSASAIEALSERLEAVREFGPAMLPAYRRQRIRPARRMGFREQFKAKRETRARAV